MRAIETAPALNIKHRLRRQLAPMLHIKAGVRLA